MFNNSVIQIDIGRIIDKSMLFQKIKGVERIYKTE